MRKVIFVLRKFRMKLETGFAAAYVLQGGSSMKNRFKFLGIIAAVAIIGFSMTGCATSMITPGWDQQLMLPCGKYTRDYTILGVVQVEETRTAIIGSATSFTVPLFRVEIPSVSLIRFTRGSATYASLLAAARRQFPRANAVIGVQIDRTYSNFLLIFALRRYIVTGLAVEFARNPNE